MTDTGEGAERAGVAGFAVAGACRNALSDAVGDFASSGEHAGAASAPDVASVNAATVPIMTLASFIRDPP